VKWRALAEQAGKPRAAAVQRDMRRCIATLGLALTLACGDDSATGDGSVDDGTGSTAPASSDASTSEDIDASTGTTSSATTSTGDAADTSSSTSGAPEEQEPAIAILTDANRKHPTMFGGWGPHLRGIMRSEAGELWFTVDAGPSVEANTRIDYYRHDGGAWTKQGEQSQLAGVQQNAASVMRGDTILTYGVVIGSQWIEECYFATLDPSYHACNAITIGGAPVVVPQASNYIGAALGPDDTRIVWFTTVGVAGSAGSWTYLTANATGWSAPVTSSVLGANDFGYVHAAFVDAQTLALVGEAYFGDYPNGSYGAVVAELALGQPLAPVALQSGEPDVAMYSSADAWVDRDSSATHVLARDDANTVRYFFKPAGASWIDHATALHAFADTYRARFVRDADGTLWLARGDATAGSVVLEGVASADLGAAIDWSAAERITFPSPGEGFAPPQAIYVEAPSYQTAPTGDLQLAFCGAFPDHDHEIWHGWLD
jgi:hypothetical protein